MYVNSNEGVREEGRKSIPHYYGDYVRRMFLGASVIILMVLPFYQNLVPFVSNAVLVASVVIIVLFAALINPKATVITALVDAGISVVGLYFFALYAVTEVHSADMFLTLVRQSLALIFAFALYFSVKTVRARLIRNIRVETSVRHRVNEE